jgi:GGDEF domain-containing protein
MLKRSRQPDPDLSSSERLGESIGRLKEAPAGHNGQTLPGVAAPTEPGIAIPARPEELQRLLGASIDENRHLTARIRRLEAELGRRSAEVAKLRGELRGAVQDALTDPLTGLANRRSFDLELRRIVARAGRSSPAHLMIADIDHFKRLNDVHGHDIGDEVLRIVGEVLLAHIRRDNLVARVGGDEFGLLLPGAARTMRSGLPRACASSSRAVRSSCAASPRSLSGSPFRSGLPLGMRIPVLPVGLHAPTRRFTRRSDAAATGSCSISATRALPKLGSLPPRRPCDDSQAPAVPSKRIASTVADAD